MDWLVRLRGQDALEPHRRDPGDDFWYMLVGGPSAAGVEVTYDNVLRLPAVSACLAVVSGALAQLPFAMFERQTNGDKRQARFHPLHELIHDRPNEEHTAIEFREMLTWWVMLRGTAYAEKVPGRRGAVDQLVPIHPDHIRVKKVADNAGRMQWQWFVKEPAAPERRLLRDELFIVRSKVVGADQVTGLDVVMAERETFGAALAVHEYGARFFLNDATPRTIFKHPRHFADKASRENWLSAIKRALTGKRRHNPLVLEHGMDVARVAMTNDEAQFHQTQKQRDLEIAQIFGVQPHKIGILDRATFSNIEQQSIEFVVDTLMPWLVRWEQAVQRDLIREPRFFAEHNVAGLLRGDIESRYRAYAIGRNWGWLSANDVLRLENTNGIGPEGDIYLQQRNMMEAGEEGEPSGQGVVPTRQDNGNGGAYRRNGSGVWVPNH